MGTGRCFPCAAGETRKTAGADTVASAPVQRVEKSSRKVYKWFAHGGANPKNLFSAATCAWMKTPLAPPVWNLSAGSRQIMRAAGCAASKQRHSRCFENHSRGRHSRICPGIFRCGSLEIGEVGGPLLQEGGHALGLIVGGERQGDAGGFQIQAAV